VHEEFAFWSLTDWEEALRQIGFVVNQASHVYTNEWIVENRWKEKVALFRRLGDHLVPLPYPPTTCRLVAEKPDASEGPTE
jgi:hypothetical protein